MYPRPSPPPPLLTRKEAHELPALLKNKIFTKENCQKGKFENFELDDYSMSDPQVLNYLRQNCREQKLISIEPTTGRIMVDGSAIFSNVGDLLAKTYAECEQNWFFDGKYNTVYKFNEASLNHEQVFEEGMQKTSLRNYLKEACSKTEFIKFKKDIYPWIRPLLKLLQERKRRRTTPKMSFLDFLWNFYQQYPLRVQQEYGFGKQPIDASVEVMFRRILDSEPSKLGEIEATLHGMNNARSYEDVSRYIYSLTNHSKVAKTLEENYSYTLGDKQVAEVGFRVFEANPTFDISGVVQPIFQQPKYSQVISRQPTSDGALAAENYIHDTISRIDPVKPDGKIFIKQKFRLLEKPTSPLVSATVDFSFDGLNMDKINDLKDYTYDELIINILSPPLILFALNNAQTIADKIKPSGRIKFIFLNTYGKNLTKIEDIIDAEAVLVYNTTLVSTWNSEWNYDPATGFYTRKP